MNRVSVVMPCHNSSKTISNAINSILSQTHKELELIIVNDGSYDDITDKVRKFSKDKRVKFFNQDHKGIPASRNFGVAQAKGNIIFHQDADDMSMPDRIEKCLAHMIKKKADVVYHGLYVNVFSGMYQCMERNYVRANELSIPRLLRSQYIPGVCVFRKSVWEKKPFREETKFCYDWMMYLDWALSGYKLVPLDLGLYEYVRYIGSSSHRFEKEGKRDESLREIEFIVKNEYGKTMDTASQRSRLVKSYAY